MVENRKITQQELRSRLGKHSNINAVLSEIEYSELLASHGLRTPGAIERLARVRKRAAVREFLATVASESKSEPRGLSVIRAKTKVEMLLKKLKKHHPVELSRQARQTLEQKEW